MEELTPTATAPKAPLTPGQKKRRAADAKGKRLELQIKAWLESQGWLVETAPKVVHWPWDKEKGRRVPRSSRRDFFQVWDGVAVKGPLRIFYQVTTRHHVPEKVRKIAESEFPAGSGDRIFGYLGPPKRWLVLAGPHFMMPGGTFSCSAPTTRRGSHDGAAGAHHAVLRVRPSAAAPSGDLQGVRRHGRGDREHATA